MVELGWGEEWDEVFEGWIEQQGGEGTRRDYRRIAGQFLEFCGKRPELVQREDVERWKAHLAEQEYAVSTVRTFLATVRSFFKEAIGRGLVNANPVEAGMAPKVKPYSSGRYLSDEEETRLLKAIDVETVWGRRDYALILFLLRSGRKTEEILGLRWGDFEVQKGGIELRDGMRREKLDWEVWGAVYRHLEGCGRLEGIKDEDLIFTPLTDAAGRVEKFYGADWREHALAEGSVGRLIQMYAGWAGLAADEITPKALRYTAGRRKWRAGCTLEELCEFLGHTEVETTRAWLRELKTEGGKKGAAYKSQRRKRGAKPGNTNADVVTRYLAEMLTKDGLDEEMAGRKGVQMEGWMLRQAINKLFEEGRQVTDLDTAIRILNVMGLACMRVVKLAEVEEAMKGKGQLTIFADIG